MKKTKNRIFDTQGFVVVDYPKALRHSVEKAVGAWQQFFQLPTADKSLFPYNGNLGVGYELKVTKGDTLDHKENFHYTEMGEKWLLNETSIVEDKTGLVRIKPFIEASKDLVSMMRPTVLEIATQIEKEYKLSGFVDEVSAGEQTWFVRFIHYFGNRKVGDVTANAHTDKSGFTLHLYESHPGLQCLSFDNKWKNMPVDSGRTVVIPSMQLQLKTKGEAKALCHRVIATPETAEMGRVSAVCFIPFIKTPKYNKDGAGRLQEAEPGFNYSIKSDDFTKFFK